MSGSTSGEGAAPAPEDAHRVLAEIVRVAGRDVLATLARWTGNLALAEDAVQDASLRALQTWPRDGIPDSPVAWLRTTARRCAVDLIRREAARAPKEALAVGPPAGESLPDEDPGPGVVEDDLLRLVFTCCHPSLAPETRVALALRTLCGLGTEEVARALLVSEPTMAKRLTRARQKIRVAGIPYRVPSPDELPDRWDTVLATAYLLFNEGYAATAGPELMRPDLVTEGLRLARLLRRLRPSEPGATGLLALMLLQDSRRAARTDDAGAAVLLADQDRGRWDAVAIGEAVPLVGEGLRQSPGHPDRYVVQSAIAACHALAPSWEQTDWAAIVSWYEVLRTVDDGPVVRLNHAVAVAEARGAQAGLDLVDAVDGLEAYPLWHATRAALLRRLGRGADAGLAEARARSLPLNAVQRTSLER
ncbi:MAG TPA: sigma-70 family RNA polymerase sigma factor [Acidimicrobiales bacterium]|nr:sigma-70 family RNA polymerase sigma factor [Acidimicrobiales bacterium]